jgi:hypothetical protein
MVRSFVVFILTAVSCTCCGIEPCGEHDGDVVIRNSSDADKHTCYTSITGGLQVNANERLSSFQLPYLESIGSSLMLVYNYELKEFDLRSLVYVKEGMEIEGNHKLPDLDGLSSLAYIGGDLTIRAGWGASEPEYFNDELSDISGLGNVESIAGDIRIENNPRLPTCEAEALVARLKYFFGTATISGNDSNATCQ